MIIKEEYKEYNSTMNRFMSPSKWCKISALQSYRSCDIGNGGSEISSSKGGGGKYILHRNYSCQLHKSEHFKEIVVNIN